MVLLNNVYTAYSKSIKTNKIMVIRDNRRPCLGNNAYKAYSKSIKTNKNITIIRTISVLNMGTWVCWVDVEIARKTVLTITIRPLMILYL